MIRFLFRGEQLGSTVVLPTRQDGCFHTVMKAEKGSTGIRDFLFKVPVWSTGEFGVWCLLCFIQVV